MDKIKSFFKYLVLTNLGRIILTFVLMAVSFITSDYVNDNITLYSVLQYTGYGCVAILMIYTLVFIVFGCIINPIREWKQNKKLKEESENKQS